MLSTQLTPRIEEVTSITIYKNWKSAYSTGYWPGTQNLFMHIGKKGQGSRFVKREFRLKGESECHGSEDFYGKRWWKEMLGPKVTKGKMKK